LLTHKIQHFTIGRYAPFLVFFLFFLWNASLVVAQSDSLYIGEIQVSGNKRTRMPIIQREMLVQAGQTFAVNDLVASMEESQRLLQNTALFIKTDLHICNMAQDTVVLCLEVVEAWYLFPVIIFELADRNFNVWYRDFDASLERVSYGFYLNHYNLTGNRDEFKIRLQYGYTRKHEISYDISQLPGLPKWGVGLNAAYFRNRELQYSTLDNRQLFYKNPDDFLIHRTQYQLHATYRPGTIWHHRFSAGYRHIKVDPIVTDSLNAQYFTEGRRENRFFYLQYKGQFDRTIDRPYPFRGYAVSIEALKEGLGLIGHRSRTWLSSSFLYCLPTGQGHGFAFNLQSRVQLERQNPGFFEYRALGYGGDFLRGYEYYVIDGLDFGLLKSSWRFTIINREVPLPLPGWPVLDKVRRMPFQIYGQVYTDHGIAHDPYFSEGNFLADRWLGSVGIGLDFRFYFDKSYSIQWSFNRLGENGVFLHSQFKL
jgi:outer membrane protein assembly factor BamA